MSGKVIGILGATGVVGTQMLQCLEERDFPVEKVVPFASQRSVDAGRTVSFRGEEIPVQVATPERYAGLDILFSAVGDDLAERELPVAAAAGALCIDNSHAWRMDPDVPLVVPEINPDDVKQVRKGIIANPNCATIIGIVPLWPLHQAWGLERIICSTYQAASGAGKPGLDELDRETRCVAAGEPVGETSPFPYQLAMNLIPQIGSQKEEGYTSEEVKMLHEGRKIMHLPALRVNCTCVRVPVARSHSESITAEFERPVSVEEAREILAAAPGVKLVDDLPNHVYPMPLDTSDQDLVWVGRIRKDTSAPEGTHSLTFWCCGDQIRKGAATNAVQIAELLI